MAKKSNSEGDRNSSAVRTDERPDSKEGNVQAPEIICTVVRPGRMGKSRAIQQYLRRCGQSSADEGGVPPVPRFPMALVVDNCPHFHQSVERMWRAFVEQDFTVWHRSGKHGKR
jgi:hypothetical protein